MAVPFYIPNWLTPPDPVATYQRGIALGAQIGEAQANQRLRAQQLEQEANNQAVAASMEQQKMEQLNAYRQAQLGLEASETARRVQGQMKYSSLVQGGMDPMQAMMQTPEVWGSSLTGVASAMKEAEHQKALANFQPQYVEAPGGATLYSTQPGHFAQIRMPNEEREARAQERIDMQRERMQMQAEERQTAREVAMLKTQLLTIDKAISQGEPNADKLKKRRKLIVDRLSELGAVSDVDLLTDEEEPVASGPATKYPGVRSVKRL